MHPVVKTEIKSETVETETKLKSFLDLTADEDEFPPNQFKPPSG